MKTTSLVSLFIGALGSLGSLPYVSVAQHTPATVATVASYPHGQFLENLSLGPDRALIMTSYIDRRLLAWDGTGAPRTLVTLDAHPVGVLSRGGDVIVSAHGASFMDGPGFTSTNRVLVLDRRGNVLRTIPAPDALFLNGLVEVTPDVVLVADSLAGRVWRFEPATGALSEWLSDPLFAPDPAGAGRPGANGLKVRDGWLYVSNSSRRALYRVKLEGTRPTGPVETVVTPVPIDDFTFLDDGSIVAATHTERLIRIGSDQVVSDVMASGCDSCTSVTPFGPDGDLIVLTTGDLVEGGSAPARVLRVLSPLQPN